MAPSVLYSLILSLASVGSSEAVPLDETHLAGPVLRRAHEESKTGQEGRQAVQQEPDTARYELDTTWQEPHSTRQELDLSSAETELARGRAWHALRELDALFPQGPGRDRELRLLFARAHAGWKDWTGVLETLRGDHDWGWEQAGDALYLQGRALEGQERWEEADSAYGKLLQRKGQEVGEGEVEEGAAEDEGRFLEVRVRRARLRGRMGRFEEALEDAQEVLAHDSTMASWVALGLAEAAAAAGAREETRLALTAVEDDEIRQMGWSFPGEALLAHGDSIGAEASFWSALPTLSSTLEQARAWDRVGTLRLARADSLGARAAFHQVLNLASSGPLALRAAESLRTLGLDSASVAVVALRVLVSAGRHGEALETFQTLEGLSGGDLDPSIRLLQARSRLGVGEVTGALALAEELAETDDPTVALASVVLEIQALRRLGRAGEARAVQEEMIARFPESDEAVEVLFLRADALQDRGDTEGAIRGFAATAELAPALNLAGEARMRMGQLLLGAGRKGEALAVYREYLDDFPDGRRWDQAAYWAGRILQEDGRGEESRDLLERIRRDAPVSYYSVLASDLLGEPFQPVPEGRMADSLLLPSVLARGLARIDRMVAAGMERSAQEVARLTHRVREDSDTARRSLRLLRLAVELNRRGFTREGINLGWELRRQGQELDRSLLRIIYPFPYRDILLAEARDRGVDPFLMAGLIRQESAFWAQARSRADARGLMQVLPSTGRALARAQGPSGFVADVHLYDPEINIHLGTAFFVDMERRFGEDLPIILSAYNAGPSRADRWRRFPEAQDMPRFVERIPFEETRGYVRNVTANHAIYRWLYGGAPGMLSPSSDEGKSSIRDPTSFP